MRTPARLQLLQRFGLLGAPLAWAGQLVVGQGVTQADCSPAGTGWDIGASVWQIALLASAAAVALAALAAAVALYLETRGVDHTDPPPPGRLHFFAVGSMAVGVIFLVIIVLSGAGALYLPECRQS